jgi:hypothetical protein
MLSECYRSAEQAYAALRSHLRDCAGMNRGGGVSWADFLLFYVPISAVVTEDEDYELLLRNSWKQSDAYASKSMMSPTNRRVLVTRRNGKFFFRFCCRDSRNHFLSHMCVGTSDVVEVEDPMTAGRFDERTVRTKLRDNGMSDVVDIRI